MDRAAACRALSTPDLIASLKRLSRDDKRCTTDILIHLAEADSRKATEELGFPSLYQYCVSELRYQESVAYHRIHASRAAKAFPVILELIDSGELNVGTVALVTPLLTDANHRTIIDAAKGKSRKEVEAYLAAMQPTGPRPDLIVRCGPVVMARAQWPAASSPEPGQPPQPPPALDIVEALDAERRRLHFDVGPETAQLIERAREILRHKFPLATLEDIVREALNLLLDSKDLDRDDGPLKAARPSAPGSRDIPLWVRRAVWKRDEGRCVFVGDGGKNCGGRSWLEFDHIVPFARGGRSDDPANIRLLCRTHNRLEADRVFAGGRPV